MSVVDPLHRRIRSFVRREGRMTDGQKMAIEQLWPRYGLDASALVYDLPKIFGRKAPVILEIGFGNGEHLLSRAQSEPRHDFIGVEVHRPGVGRVLHHADKAGLTNLRAASHDAVELLQQNIADGVLHEIVIYFPDPWHKTRHHKRRLIQPEFVTLLARKLRRGGYLHLATDWEDYAHHMLEVLGREPALTNTPDAVDGFTPRPDYRGTSSFERKGLAKGHSVWDLVFIKK